MPQFHVDGYIDFLVDTGADITTLHPRDALPMGVDYDQLNSSASPHYGIGGIEYPYEEPAIIFFEDGRFVRLYSVRVSIPKPADHNMSFPSLLGQDIIQHWRMVHDKPRDRITFTVQRADVSVRGRIT